MVRLLNRFDLSQHSSEGGIAGAIAVAVAFELCIVQALLICTWNDSTHRRASALRTDLGRPVRLSVCYYGVIGLKSSHGFPGRCAASLHDDALSELTLNGVYFRIYSDLP